MVPAAGPRLRRDDPGDGAGLGIDRGEAHHMSTHTRLLFAR